MKPAVLVITETKDLSTDLVILELQRRGISFSRLNQDQAVSGGRLTWDLQSTSHNPSVSGHGFADAVIPDRVWYRRPFKALAHLDETSQYAKRQEAAFLEGVWRSLGSTHWINRPQAVEHASNKLVQLSAATRSGLTIPQTRVTNDPAEARRFVQQVPETVAKPISGGAFLYRGRRSMVFTSKIGEEELRDDDAVASCPLMLQRLVRGRDVRVTVVGHELFATHIDIDNRDADEIDWRVVPEERLSYSRIELKSHLAERIQRLMLRLNLVFGAIDFVVDGDGNFHFLEVNPAGQWGWIEAATEIPLTSRIVEKLLAS